MVHTVGFYYIEVNESPLYTYSSANFIYRKFQQIWNLTIFMMETFKKILSSKKSLWVTGQTLKNEQICEAI